MVNEKLNIKWRSTDIGIRPKRTNGSTTSNKLISVTVRPDTKSKGEFAYIALSFHERAMTQAGWEKGDLIALEYDNGMVLLYKDSHGSKIGKSSPESKRHSLLIRVIPSCVQMFKGMQASAIEIENGRMAFVLKEDA